MKNSSHQFFYTPQSNDQYLLAGYPWFKVRARDQFISLPGCTLAVGRVDDFEKIMDTAVVQIRAVIDGKPTKGLLKQITDPDLPLGNLGFTTICKGKTRRVPKEICRPCIRNHRICDE